MPLLNDLFLAALVLITCIRLSDTSLVESIFVKFTLYSVVFRLLSRKAFTVSSALCCLPQAHMSITAVKQHVSVLI